MGGTNSQMPPSSVKFLVGYRQSLFVMYL